MSPSDRTRVIMSRRTNKAFMEREETSIILRRRDRIDSGAGGWVNGPWKNLLPQTFRLTPFKRRLGIGELASPDGSIANSQFLLMGAIDADIKKNDEFELDGETYFVMRIHPKRLTRTMAVVEWQGKKDLDA